MRQGFRVAGAAAAATTATTHARRQNLSAVLSILPRTIPEQPQQPPTRERIRPSEPDQQRGAFPEHRQRPQRNPPRAGRSKTQSRGPGPAARDAPVPLQRGRHVRAASTPAAPTASAAPLGDRPTRQDDLSHPTPRPTAIPAPTIAPPTSAAASASLRPGPCASLDPGFAKRQRRQVGGENVSHPPAAAPPAIPVGAVPRAIPISIVASFATAAAAAAADFPHVLAALAAATATAANVARVGAVTASVPSASVAPGASSVRTSTSANVGATGDDGDG